jgi:hypothetical protein
MRRDGGRCCVPGCRHATYVDVHHILPRADGGGHDPEGLCVLCGAHHRASHRGSLIIEGTASEGFRFLHADGTVYGGRVQPELAGASRDAFLALRGLGCRQTQARRAVEAARATFEPESVPSASELVRAALRTLSGKGQPVKQSESRMSAADEAVLALRSLGFRGSEALQAVDAARASLDASSDLSTTELVRAALRISAAKVRGGQRKVESRPPPVEVREAGVAYLPRAPTWARKRERGAARLPTRMKWPSCQSQTCAIASSRGCTAPSSVSSRALGETPERGIANVARS